MAEAISIRQAFTMIGKGHLALCMISARFAYRTVVNNKLATALVISVAVNVWQSVIISRQSIERDADSKVVAQLQQFVDSAEGKKIKYYSFK